MSRPCASVVPVSNTQDPIHNTDDYIDSRDVIARIAYLESLGDWDESDAEELAALRELAEDGEQLTDWNYGETLVRDSYFKTYAQETAESIGAISGDEQWPLNCIDWDRATNELKIDYTPIEFDGVTYWGRS